MYPDRDRENSRKNEWRRDPPGRFMMESAFKGKSYRYHAGHAVPSYMLRCAKMLLAGSKVNLIERVRVIDSKLNTVLWEGHANAPTGIKI